MEGDNDEEIYFTKEGEDIYFTKEGEAQDDEGDWDDIYTTLFDPIFLVHNFLGSSSDGYRATTIPEAISYDNFHAM
eukprot:14558383-Heterocapsa_arctica.AAC.1